MCYMSWLLFIVVLFFFKQKTAYEMRISDWSSDVCSSDLFAGYPDRSCRAAAETGERGTCAMIGWLGDAYPWIKALHVIFVIFWIAGLFMLPRFLVYHYPVPPHSAEDALWIERERRLLRILINPTMILTWVLGLMLAFNLGWGGEGRSEERRVGEEVVST